MLTPSPPPCPPAAAGPLPPPPYEDNSGVSFQFINSQLEADKNELECQKLCGHLASYDTLSQQSEVEAYYESAVSDVLLKAIHVGQ